MSDVNINKTNKKTTYFIFLLFFKKKLKIYTVQFKLYIVDGVVVH